MVELFLAIHSGAELVIPPPGDWAGTHLPQIFREIPLAFVQVSICLKN
jgi:hypothetical protein